MYTSDCEDKEKLQICIDILNSSLEFEKYTRYVVDIYSYDKSKHDKYAKKEFEKYQEITTSISLSKLFRNHELLSQVEVNDQLFMLLKEFFDRFENENEDELPENLQYYQVIKK